MPANALYGVQTVRAIRNFPITGWPPHPALVQATVLVKKAAADQRDWASWTPSGRTRLLPRPDQVLGGALREQWRVDPFQAGAGTSHNMNTNEVLANRANESLGGSAAPTSRSTPTTTSTWPSRPTT